MPLVTTSSKSPDASSRRSDDNQPTTPDTAAAPSRRTDAPEGGAAVDLLGTTWLPAPAPRDTDGAAETPSVALAPNRTPSRLTGRADTTVTCARCRRTAGFAMNRVRVVERGLPSFLEPTGASVWLLDRIEEAHEAPGTVRFLSAPGRPFVRR